MSLWDDLVSKSANALGEFGDAAMTGIGYLDYPLRKTKEAISGNEDVWANNFDAEGNQRLPHGLYAGLSVAGDIALDPLNVAGAGLMKAGAKGLQALGIADDAGKGMITAAADNYIDNHYVPKGPDEASTIAERAVAKLLEAKGSFKGVEIDSPEKAKGAAESAVSTVNTVGVGAKEAAKDLMSPYAQALWKTTAVSRSGQNIIKKHLDNPKAYRSKDKAGAEAIYQGHQAIQAGREIPDGPLKNFLNKALLEWYQPMKEGTISNMLIRNAPTKNAPLTPKGKGLGLGEAAPLSTSQAKFAESFIKRHWPGTDTIVMKRPEHDLSGKHQFDLFNDKNHSVKAYKQALKSKPETSDELAGLLEDYAKAHPKFNIKVLRDGDEVYLSSSRAGSAIVEGGYRGLHNVKPDGEVWAIMSDEHNFLEKVPVLGKVVGSYLPNKLLAITPPLRKNFLVKQPKQFRGMYDQAGAKHFNDLSKNTQTMMKDLEDIAALKPPKEVVREEAKALMGGALSGTSLYQGETKDATK